MEVSSKSVTNLSKYVHWLVIYYFFNSDLILWKSNRFIFYFYELVLQLACGTWQQFPPWCYITYRWGYYLKQVTTSFRINTGNFAACNFALIYAGKGKRFQSSKHETGHRLNPILYNDATMLATTVGNERQHRYTTCSIILHTYIATKHP